MSAVPFHFGNGASSPKIAVGRFWNRRLRILLDLGTDKVFVGVQASSDFCSGGGSIFSLYGIVP